MTKEDILRLRDTAEQTRVQFKERVAVQSRYQLTAYTGAGSGIARALMFTPDIKFVNDETLNEFVVTFERRKVGETDAKNDRDNKDRDNDRFPKAAPSLFTQECRAKGSKQVEAYRENEMS